MFDWVCRPFSARPVTFYETSGSFAAKADKIRSKPDFAFFLRAFQTHRDELIPMFRLIIKNLRAFETRLFGKCNNSVFHFFVDFFKESRCFSFRWLFRFLSTSTWSYFHFPLTCNWWYLISYLWLMVFDLIKKKLVMKPPNP